MIDTLQKNIETEIGMLRELSRYSTLLEHAPQTEQKLLIASMQSLQASMKMINDSIPQIVAAISVAQRLPAKTQTLPLEKITFTRNGSDAAVIVRKEDREQFFRELSITENAMKKMQKQLSRPKEKSNEIKSSRGYFKLSNKLFIAYAERFIKQGKFKQLKLNIQKANIDVLLESYISMMMFTSVLAFFAGIFLLAMLLFFDISLSYPFIISSKNPLGIELLKLFWIPLALPVAAFYLVYFYPNTEKKTIQKKIDQELPFAVIHMGAISGSGIEPTNIFKIIALSKEYPALRKEIRKIMNQINLYGYDLVTALNNVARITPSTKLSELFIGLSTTINSGGDLTEFFEKRSESLLVVYRIEREKFTKVAETFMDIYITIAIAAPMILLLILVMLSLSDFNLGLSPQLMTGLIIGSVSVINVAFLMLLQIKQPSY